VSQESPALQAGEDVRLKPLPEERVLEIVDQLFMPLVEAAKRSA
jgi:hypothetical protein